ncbi:unnamed protein product [Bursaphelenchus xylophilus]|uniref:(pine wood nematode) hypothetical protein n=1 Tax=Bursaphelenchus xylophilus TaxID=6326 RepID=A0A1I7RHH5_BURXY|nr:unnamed protein product [Bursaphelenchus xylophilus]CAG9115750.1 unnamed protein product [Bursaphelenchus xylophilus]
MIKRIFVLSLLTSTGLCCMPGYEMERAKLRQYLGIEWIPKAMDKADATTPKFIRHSMDLNCDFKHPEDCRWMNLKGVDSLDFHLFKKEDHTPFPVVQVRPGPSKVEVGDHLLFTGDRKKSNKDAILASWPIKCQNSTGLLTFTFWIYNGARVEVLMLEDAKVGNKTEIRFLPEKLHVDCGTVTMDTECKVEIPPREEPFRLAIRAYDISHPEGSFVMVDNIFYEAQLCKVAIDFGPNFETEELKTSAQGSPVNTAADLSCINFDESCRWRNGGHDGTLAWRKGVSRPSEAVMFNETGTYTVPKGAYAFLYIEQDHSTGIRRLVSDPIDCQASSGSTLTFRVWANKGLGVDVCAMDLDMNELECQQVSIERSPAPSTHHFSYTKNFMYGIKVTVADHDRDHFLMLDDIDYEATMCTEAFGSLDFGKGFYTTPFLGVILNRAAHSADDLACDFSRRGLDCFWANLDEENTHNKWEVGLGAIDERKFEFLTHKNTVPTSDFAVARFPKSKGPKTAAILISEVIRCMYEGASLGLSFWRTGDAILSVCVVKSFNDQILDCQDVGEGSAERIEVDIPNYQEPIRLALKAEIPEDLEDGEGLIAVDDLVLSGKICSTVAFSANSHHSGRLSGPKSLKTYEQADVGPVQSTANHVPSSSTPDSNVCRLLSCDFNNGHMCLYESHRVANSVSMFTAFNNTGHSMLFERGKISIMESSVFSLNAPARLHFDYSMMKGRAQVHVCQDSIRQELDQCYAVKNTEKVKLDGTFAHDFIEILPSDTKIYIIVKLGEKEKKSSVFIDNLVLTDIENHRIC